MKISRLKKVQKNLAFFVNNFKFHEPYQVLIDGTFSLAAFENKFNIQEQMPKYFQAECKLLTTACVIIETEKLGVYKAMNIVKQFALHKCAHEKNPVSGAVCLRSMVRDNNSSRYIIATQDRELQKKIRMIPGVPLLYLHGHAPTLETPSEATKIKAQELRNSITLNNHQAVTLENLKEKAGLITNDDVKTKKKHKKRGPNPLSCKKKQNNKPVHVRRRKKVVNIPAHVIEALKSN